MLRCVCASDTLVRDFLINSFPGDLAEILPLFACQGSGSCLVYGRSIITCGGEANVLLAVVCYGAQANAVPFACTGTLSVCPYLRAMQT
jgi:hypothetical protein